MLSCRAALAADYPDFLVLFNELGVDDPTPTPETWKVWLPDAFFVLEGGQKVGYGMTRATPPLGHVVHVVTHPRHRGRGIGRAIMAEAARRLRDQGCTQWYLNVFPDNRPAVALYRSLGMSETARGTALRWPWEASAALGAEPCETVALPDPKVEADLGLTPGQLAGVRARGLSLTTVGKAGRALALAAYDSAMNGLYPFRARRLTLVRPLFDQLPPAAHDRPLRLFVEGDEGLAEALLAAGAELVMRTIRMEGPL